MNRAGAIAIAGAALVASCLAQPAAAADCGKSGGPPEVFVKAKTPIRRGPGLNYPVSSFLEKGRCFKLSEVSMDEEWVLVESTDVFGWVPSKRLDAAGRKRAAEAKPSRAPVGSGQTRGYVWTNTGTSLVAAPGTSGETRKDLPEGARLLPIAATGDGRWVQVKDDRGEDGWVPALHLRDESGVLAAVPRTSERIALADAEIVASDDGGSGGGGGERIATPELRGGVIDAKVFAAAIVPSYALDSNGAAGVRRYDIQALAAGARIEGAMTSLSPVSARLSYAFALLGGLAVEGNPDRAIGGRRHELRAVAGYRIELGAVVLAPEAGYLFENVDLDPDFTGETGGKFFSSRTHGATAGLSATVGLGAGLAIEAEAAAALGATEEYPLDLGEPGLALGALGGAGLRWSLSESTGIVLRWEMRWMRVRFSGQSFSDPTITEATLEHLDQGVLAGVAFAL